MCMERFLKHCRRFVAGFFFKSAVRMLTDANQSAVLNRFVAAVAERRATLLRSPRWAGVSMATEKHASPQQPGRSVSNCPTTLAGGKTQRRKHADTKWFGAQCFIFFSFLFVSFFFLTPSFRSDCAAGGCCGGRRKSKRRASPWRPPWGTRWWVTPWDRDGSDYTDSKSDSSYSVSSGAARSVASGQNKRCIQGL